MSAATKATKQRGNNVKRRGNPDKIKGQGFHTNPERINRKGRPQKWYSNLVDTGYTRSQINDCISSMIAATPAELEKVRKNPGAKFTALEIAVSAVVLKSIKNGEIRDIEILLARVHGGPNTKVALDIGLNARSNKRIFIPHNNRDEKEIIPLNAEESKAVTKT